MKLLKFALINIRRFRRHHFSVSFMIFFGLIALIFANGFIQKSYWGLRESSIHQGVGHFQLIDERQKQDKAERQLQYGIAKPEQDRLISLVMKNESSVDAVMPRVSFSGIIAKGEKSTIFMANGVRPTEEKRFAKQFLGLKEGRFIDDSGTIYQANIGWALAKIMGAKVGDTITLMSTTVDGAINAMDFEVVGLSKTSVEELDKRIVTVPLAAAQKMLKTDRVSNIIVGLKNTNETESFIAPLRSSLSEGGGRIKIYHWIELSPFYNGVVNLYTGFFMFLGGLIAFLVVLSVGGSVSSAVMERTKEIGTLKANGYTNLRILALLLLETALLSVIVSLVALIAGHILVEVVNNAHIKMPPPPGYTEGYPLGLEHDYLATFKMAMFIITISLLAALRPAFRAFRLKISAALRA